jgi:hypothetical protein
LGGGALVIQGQEAGEDFVFGEVGGPTVGGEYGFVEGAMGVGEPFGALVVEVGEGAFFKDRLGGVRRVGVCGVDFDGAAAAVPRDIPQGLKPP